jgi:serine/threonine protein kinase
MTRKEVDLLCKLDHPNVVRIFEHACDDFNQTLVMVLEYMQGGDCLTLLEEANGTLLTESLCGRLLHQALTALCYCHSQGVVHRDIKPDNMMLADSIDRAAIGTATDALCKLIDFGLAEQRATSKQGPIGTPPYMAPEIAKAARAMKNRCPTGNTIIHASEWTATVDMWSLGVTGFEMIMDEGPFLRESNDDTFAAISQYTNYEDLKQRSAWCQRSTEAHDFLRMLLVADANKRPTANEALDNIWIQMHKGTRNSLGAEMIHSLSGYQDAPPLVRCCLYVIASRLDIPDLERFGATFLRLDTDGDGMITREDLTQAFTELEKDWPSECNSLDADTILDAADLNHAGGINFTEFVAACLYARHIVQDHQASLGHLLERAFDALDDDRDGWITLDQVTPLFRERDAPSLQRLPQDRPFDKREWSECLRDIHAKASSSVTRPRLFSLETPIMPPELLRSSH